MGLGKERFFSLQHSSENLAPLPQNGVFYRENIPIPNSQEQRRLGEVRIKLKEQRKKEFREAFNRLVGNNGFEPFANPSNDGEDQFVNNYTGNFWENMMLNREAVERVLEIAHLDGQVFLSSRGSLPKNPIEANSDGSVTAKRTLSIEQKIEEEEGKNPFYRVESIPQGWNIIVNDKRITDELAGKRLSGDKLKRVFIERFNGIVNDGIFESIRREKLSGEKKDSFAGFAADVAISVGIPGYLSIVNGLSRANVLKEIVFTSLFSMAIFALSNFGKYLREYPDMRKIDSKCEWFMPPVEIDKVARTFAFLKVKGRKLVKEKGID